MLFLSARIRRRRGKLRRQLAWFPALAALLLGLPAQPATADSTPSDPLLAAQTLAVSSGQTVPVDALTTQTGIVDANPDGTFTSTTSLLPTRVQQNGAWTPVDATLTANGDGTYSPAATPNGVVLSGGGTGPLVTLTHADGNHLNLTLPFALPQPTISGDTALYPSVLPGVDLSVSVTDQGGFSDVLVIHDATAAANPQVKQLTLAAATQGLSLTATPSGGLNATTADGTLAYTAPEPLMWDSSTPSVAMQEAVQADDTTAGGDATSSTDGPGDGATVAPVAMSISTDAVTLTPDASELTDPSTTWPVYVDPSYNPVVNGTAAHYDEVYSSATCDDVPQYDTPQTNGEGVGYQQWGGTCGSGLERSYYAIGTGNLPSTATVISSTLTINTTYAASFSCTQNQPITLHTTGSISSTTDWNTRPAVIDSTYPPVSTTVPHGYNGDANGCHDNSTASFNLTSQAQTIIDNGHTTWTIGLYGNESQTSGNIDYLRMSETLDLKTTYDVPPHIPTNLTTQAGSNGAESTCNMTTGGTWIGATTGNEAVLHATVQTDMSGVQVRAHYHVWDRTKLDASGNAEEEGDHAPSTYVASGTDDPLTLWFPLLDGHQYGWDSYAEDNSSIHLTSPVSGHCWFSVDTTPPDSPSIDTNSSFPPVGTGPANPLIYASATTTDFTIRAADGAPSDSSCSPNPCQASGIDHFIWKLDSQPTPTNSTLAEVTTTDPDGTAHATLPVPISAWGVHTLYVAAVDKAGNLSTSPTGYTFTVPWNPATAVQPGDITGDGIPDLLSTTNTGDLEVIPGDRDSSQAAINPSAPGTADYTGPVLTSTAENTPAGTPGDNWNNYLLAHRGSLTGKSVDDLFALDTQSSPKKLYIVHNDLDSNSSTYGFSGEHNTTPSSTKPTCEPTTPADRCSSVGYSTDWNSTTQIAAPGDVYGAGTADLITIENNELWIYEGTVNGSLVNPVLLGDGDWSGLTLLTPGTVGGTPTLWARDNTTGALYTWPLALDPSTELPVLLHATTRTVLPLTLPPATYPVVATVGDVNSTATDGRPDSNPDLYTIDPQGHLTEYPGTAPTGTAPNYTATFTSTPISLGTITDTAAHWWNLDDGTGTTATDKAGTLNGTLSGAYTWTTDANRGTVLALTGTTGYAATSGAALDTSKSFSVSAWVNLSSLSANSTLVSQSDTAGNGDGFQLYYSSSTAAWAFNRHNDDTTAGTNFSAVYGGTPTVGAWTHLVAVYNATTQQMSLYVNSQLVGSTSYTGTTWNAAGPLQIGRRLGAGNYGEYANAKLSDIHVYNTALTPADATAVGENPPITSLG